MIETRRGPWTLGPAGAGTVTAVLSTATTASAAVQMLRAGELQDWMNNNRGHFGGRTRWPACATTSKGVQPFWGIRMGDITRLNTQSLVDAVSDQN